VVESLRSGIRRDVVSVSVGLTACQAVRSNLDKMRHDFTQHLSHVRAVIESTVQQLTNHIDQDEDKLVAGLTRVRENGGARFMRDRQEVMNIPVFTYLQTTTSI